MAKTILQRVKFSASPGRLFDIYLDSKKHSSATEARASIARKVGRTFTAHNGWIRGKNLAILPKRMIVQSWRGANWKKADLDSILILTFTKAPGGARLTLVHANVPDQWSARINTGWHTHYWRRWRAYLRRTG